LSNTINNKILFIIEINKLEFILNIIYIFIYLYNILHLILFVFKFQ